MFPRRGLPAPVMKSCSMPIQICCACGTSYPDAAESPSRCLICEDERQFVPRGGQVWTTPEKLADGHINAWRQLERDLFEIHTHPQLAGRDAGNRAGCDAAQARRPLSWRQRASLG